VARGIHDSVRQDGKTGVHLNILIMVHSTYGRKQNLKHQQNNNPSQLCIIPQYHYVLRLYILPTKKDCAFMVRQEITMFNQCNILFVSQLNIIKLHASLVHSHSVVFFGSICTHTITLGLHYLQWARFRLIKL